MSAEFYYYLDLFSGWGGGFNQSGQFRENVALLKDMDTGEFGIDFVPELEIEPGDVYSGYQSRINEEIDALVSDVKSDTLSIKYPVLGIKLRQAGGWRGMSVRLASGTRHHWGLSFWRAMALGGRLTGNSLLLTLNSDIAWRDDEESKVVLGNDFSAELNMQLNQMRIGYAYSWSNGITIGIGIDLLDLELKADGYSRTEGFIRQYGGDTDIMQAFNDPVDALYYRNTLDNSWQSDYAELLTGFNGGLAYQLTESSLIDLGFSQPYKQEISGESEGIIHSLGAVDYEALIGESAGELFDELLLEPSRMTYSNKTIYSCRSMLFKYPGLIRLGLGLQNGRTRHQINMSTYLGELSCRYKGSVYETGREKTDGGFANFERTTEVDYTYGWRLQSKLEYNLQHYLNGRLGLHLSLQYYTLSEVMDNIKDESGAEKEGESIMNLVAGNLGINWQISTTLNAECFLLSFPGAFLQTRLTYRFGTYK